VSKGNALMLLSDKNWAGELSCHGGHTLSVQLFDEIDSTNAEALRQFKCLDEKAHCLPTVLIAKSQTAGRGRRGRAWVSKPGAGLYLSLMRSFTLAPDALQGLSLVVGMAVRRRWPRLGRPRSVSNGRTISFIMGVSLVGYYSSFVKRPIFVMS